MDTPLSGMLFPFKPDGFLLQLLSEISEMLFLSANRFLKEGSVSILATQLLWHRLTEHFDEHCSDEHDLRDSSLRSTT